MNEDLAFKDSMPFFYGTLLLLPHLLHENASLEESLVPAIQKAVSSLQGLFAESEKEARKFLRFFLPREKAYSLPLKVLSEHTKEEEIQKEFLPLILKERWGLISDRGLPCIADPGAFLVRLAHEHHVAVEAFVGPSSIFFALMLSGFCGQSFTFHGYLPREPSLLQKKLLELEKEAFYQKRTQIWIEAPYRVEKMIEILLSILKKETYLCVAEELMGDEQKVTSLSIREWEKHFSPQKRKASAIFLIEVRATK